jgi:hypothetical protein
LLIKLLLSLGIHRPAIRVVAWLTGCAALTIAGEVVGLLGVFVLTLLLLLMIATRLAHL